MIVHNSCVSSVIVRALELFSGELLPSVKLPTPYELLQHVSCDGDRNVAHPSTGLRVKTSLYACAVETVKLLHDFKTSAYEYLLPRDATSLSTGNWNDISSNMTVYFL